MREPQHVAAGGGHLLVALGRDVVRLVEQLEVGQRRRERRTELVGDRRDELVLHAHRADQVGDVVVGQHRTRALAGAVEDPARGDRQRPPRVGVLPHPQPYVVELLAARGPHRRHVVVRQQLLVAVVGEAGLPGLAEVTLGEGEVEELAVPAVGGEVAAAGIDLQQPDGDALEDRLGRTTIRLGRGLRGVEPLDEGLPLAEVDDLGDEVDRGAERVAQEGDREVADQDAAVGAEVALGDPVGADLPGERLLEQAQVGVEVLGMGDVLEGLRDELVGVVAEHLAQRDVGRHEATRRGHDRHPDRRVLHRQAPELVGLEHGRALSDHHHPPTLLTTRAQDMRRKGPSRHGRSVASPPNRVWGNSGENERNAPRSVRGASSDGLDQRGPRGQAVTSTCTSATEPVCGDDAGVDRLGLRRQRAQRPLARRRRRTGSGRSPRSAPRR